MSYQGVAGVSSTLLLTGVEAVRRGKNDRLSEVRSEADVAGVVWT